MSAQGEFDLARVAMLKQLRDGALFRQLLHTFQEQTDGQVMDMTAAAQAGDYARLASASHQMKSAAMSIGAVRFGEVCAALERHVREGDTAAARELALTLPAAYASLLPAIRAMM